MCIHLMKRVPIEESVECVCLNLRKTTRTVTQYYEDALRPVNLKATQYSLLAAIYLMGSPNMNEVAGVLELDRTSLSRSLQPLMKEKLVKVNSGDDKRQKILLLTAKGQKRLYKAFPLWKNAQQKVIQFLEQSHWKKMKGDLGQLSHFLRL